MGFSRHYFKDQNFVYTKISEEVNDNNFMQFVIDSNKKTEETPNFREFADCREISKLEKLTVQGTITCGATERERPESLLAILVSDSPLIFGLARAYQTFAEERRKSVEIFKDINKALTWLANDDQEVDIFYKHIEIALNRIDSGPGKRCYF